jgi:hypothetical protein
MSIIAVYVLFLVGLCSGIVFVNGNSWFNLRLLSKNNFQSENPILMTGGATVNKGSPVKSEAFAQQQNSKVVSGSSQIVLPSNTTATVRSTTNYAPKSLRIMKNGFTHFYSNFRKAQEVKSILKAHNYDDSVLSYSDMKLLEKNKNDMAKLFRNLLYIPLAWKFYAVTSIALPLLQMDRNILALNHLPSTFSVPELDSRKESLIYSRRIGSFYDILLKQYRSFHENQFFWKEDQKRYFFYHMKKISTALKEFLHENNLNQSMNTLLPYYSGPKRAPSSWFGKSVTPVVTSKDNNTVVLSNNKNSSSVVVSVVPKGNEKIPRLPRSPLLSTFSSTALAPIPLLSTIRQQRLFQQDKFGRYSLGRPSKID